ncbi:hypothetical protein LIER_25957 [Lithospermum erythrorhizon]|uniref:Uncharacterized protein n=1 Tax=Lithospermum erythrorhizon TaxID=34254 RepID=A0AAV3RA27_LITER
MKNIKLTKEKKPFHHHHHQNIFNLPQKTSSTCPSTTQFSESHEGEQTYPALVGYFTQEYSASKDDHIQGNREPFSAKGYRRSSSSVDEYYGKGQWRGDMMNNFETIDKVGDITKKEYRSSFSGPTGALIHGKKEWVDSPQRQEEMGFFSSASGYQNYGKKVLVDSPKMQEEMQFQGPLSGTYNNGQNEWIDSPRRRENLETNKDPELSRAQKYYDKGGYGGKPQGRQEMKTKQFSPRVPNYAQKEYIGSPKVQQDLRKMMQNLEANKVPEFSRSPVYPTKEEWNSSPRKPEVKLEDSKKWYGRSASITADDKYYDQKGLFIDRPQGQEARGRVGPNIFGNMRYEIHKPTNEFHQSQGSYIEKVKYHQSQREFADYGQQLKAPYMDAIEAAKLHGGVLILDYSK